jgi:hypothetical protein
MGAWTVEILPPIANIASIRTENGHVPGVGQPPKLTVGQVRWALIKDQVQRHTDGWPSRRCTFDNT